MKPRSNPATRPVAQPVAQLQEWEAEGGAPAGGTPIPEPGPPALSPADPRLLERLGKALVGEWDRLPTTLQRTLYDRAVAIDASGDDAALRHHVARLLHDHKGRRDTV